jgi:hypothetical protein
VAGEALVIRAYDRGNSQAHRIQSMTLEECEQFWREDRLLMRPPDGRGVVDRRGAAASENRDMRVIQRTGTSAPRAILILSPRLRPSPRMASHGHARAPIERAERGYAGARGAIRDTRVIGAAVRE